MNLLTKTYLGNQHQDAELCASLEESLPQNRCLHLHLAPRDCVKGRIHAHTTSGEKVGIIKARSWSIRDGDVFLMETGQWLVVHVGSSASIVACFSPATIGEPTWDSAKTALELVRLGHYLGNHHWPIGVEQNQITIQLSEQNRDVFEALLHEIDLPGLVVTYESRSSAPNPRLASEHRSHFDHPTHSSHAR